MSGALLIAAAWGHIDAKAAHASEVLLDRQARFIHGLVHSKR